LVARYKGDGVLVSFGYLAGHEDNAQRAVVEPDSHGPAV
jgi:class 3 adenylate cyclase